MKKFFYFVSFFFVATAVVASVASQAPAVVPDGGSQLSPDQIEAERIEAERLDSVRRADSIADAAARLVVDKAVANFKNMKMMQYDGTTEAALYPVVADVNRAVLSALDEPRISDQDITRLKGYLLDLDPLLVNGSIYYSSVGNADMMNQFAIACVNNRMRPDMRDFPFSRQLDSVYPNLVYCAASRTYNSGDFSGAIDYFLEYLKTGAQEQRLPVAMFLGHACISAKCPERGIDALVEATNAYPADYNLLMVTLQNLLDADATDRMAPLMERALLMRPDDEQLLNLQASLMENQGNFSAALDLYARLYEIHPESLQINRHLALCYYNLGVENYNKALLEENDKNSKRLVRQSKAYFTSAANKLGTVVDNDPSDTKYLRALAMTYGALGETSQLADVNRRLQALGLQPVVVAGMPEAVTYNDKAASAKGTVPDFQEFAHDFVERSLAEWATRKEFEQKKDFEKRINQTNLYNEYKRLCMVAEEEYLKKYASKLKISDVKLSPYDIDNETYRIDTDMGPITVNVPFKNKEAETFKSQWNAIQFRHPKYFIQNNRVAIASVDLATPGGKTYSFKADNAAEYEFADVTVDVNSFIRTQSEAGKTIADNIPAGGASASTLRAKSDVDRDIPITSRRAGNTVALIWANENYKNVSAVPSALNDGEVFAEYCRKTLGIPDSQILLFKNLTYAEMLGSVRKLQQLLETVDGNSDLIFYYAGHGIPDEATKDAFLMPVDGDGVMTTVTYPLKQLYRDLAAMRAENVMVFLDACFTGSTRDGNMLAEARSVALRPRDAAPEGSMMVLTAASDQQTALPYAEKNHGLFTYFLLKKLQESKGNVSLKDLSDYVIENVKKSSMTINRKLQTPSVKVVGNLAGQWDSKKLRP